MRSKQKEKMRNEHKNDLRWINEETGGIKKLKKKKSNEGNASINMTWKQMNTQRMCNDNK